MISIHSKVIAKAPKLNLSADKVANAVLAATTAVTNLPASEAQEVANGNETVSDSPVILATPPITSTEEKGYSSMMYRSPGGYHHNMHR